LAHGVQLTAGIVLGGADLDQLGAQNFEEMLAVASGKQTKSELAGIRTEEFNS
jgi:altronate hydrolase